MRLKTTLLALLTLFMGLNFVNASDTNCLPDNYNEIMTTSDNSLIVSARCNIYTVDLTTYNATLLTTSPYVAEINSLAVDATTGWIFYVSNEASRYNWTVFGYNVYTDTHKSFGDIRGYFTATGHAYSSRGLGSGGATFYNGKLYFAMEYPTRCYNYRTSSGEVNVKDELKDQLPNNLKKGSIKNTGLDNSLRGSGSKGDSKAEFVKLDGANIKGETLSDYSPEKKIKSGKIKLSDNMSQRNYYRYNNRIYLLEVCFDNLSDNTGNTSAVSTAAPKYDIYGYSSFLYRGELGDIAVSENGEIYAVTSYQIQHFDFNTNTFCWANNEDVYAQIAKDKNNDFQLAKNVIQCSNNHYNNNDDDDDDDDDDDNNCNCSRKSYLQSYTPPAQLQTYNNIQLGSLNEISGLQSADVGKITDAADYLNLNMDTLYKIQGNIFNDENENGIKDSGEGNINDVNLTLFADTNANGSLDSEDAELGNTASNTEGNYEFSAISEENVLVKITLPEGGVLSTFTLTTEEVIAITSTTDVTGVDFGVKEAPNSFGISGVVWDDNNKDGVKDVNDGETYLANVTVNLYQDTNENGVLENSDTLLSSFTTTSNNPNYEFNDLDPGFFIVEAVKPDDVLPFLTYEVTYDPDSGTTEPDGIYATELLGVQNDVDFGIDKIQGNSRVMTNEDIKTNEDKTLNSTQVLEETNSDLSQSMKVFPNPSKDFIYLENSALAGQTIKAEVLGRNGQVLISNTLEANALGLIRLDITRLHTGLHYVRLSVNSETVVKTIYKN